MTNKLIATYEGHKFTRSKELKIIKVDPGV